jgi:hypothetical protein
MIDGPTKQPRLLSAPENIAAAAFDDGFCEEVAVQSIVDGQSYRIAAHIASNSSCVDRLQIFSTASTSMVARAAALAAPRSPPRGYVLHAIPVDYPASPATVASGTSTSLPVLTS